MTLWTIKVFGTWWTGTGWTPTRAAAKEYGSFVKADAALGTARAHTHGAYMVAEYR